jgi:predicted dehydrogenase
VVTTNPERARHAERDLPGVAVVPDLDEALGTEPDLVVLATPTGVHAAQVLDCVAAGIPVVVDKPLGTDAAGARHAVRAAQAADIPLTVFQNRRWDPENLTLATLLADHTLGEVHRFERRWERWRPEPRDRWRENAPPQLGGGTLLDLFPHLIDSAVQFFGPVQRVYAELNSWTTLSEDDVFLSLAHVDGVRSHLGGSSVVAAPGPRTRVLGSSGSFVVTEFENEPSAFGGFEDSSGNCGWLVVGPDREPVPRTPGGPTDFYRAVFDALDAAPDRDRPAMPVDPWDAVHVLEVIDAARISAAEHQVVDVQSGTAATGSS